MIDTYSFQTIPNFIQLSLEGLSATLSLSELIQSDLELSLELVVVSLQFLHIFQLKF